MPSVALAAGLGFAIGPPRPKISISLRIYPSTVAGLVMSTRTYRALGSLRELDVVDESTGSRQRLQVAPSLRVVGELDCTLGGSGDPVERDLIEFAARAEVDVDPFLVKSGGHPSAGEVVRAADLDALVSRVELDLADSANLLRKAPREHWTSEHVSW